MDNSLPPTSPRLPVVTTIKGAFASTVNHSSDMLRLGWLPASGFTVVGLIGGLGQGPQRFSAWQGLISSILNLVIGAVWSIAWMRLVLGVPAAEVHLRLGSREWKYLKLFGIFGVGIAVSLVAGMLLSVLAIPLIGSLVPSSRDHADRIVFAAISVTPMLALIVLSSRCVTAFPALAIDRYQGLRAHFRQSRQNGWRVLVIVLALITPGLAVGFVAVPILRGASATITHVSALLLGLLAVPASAFAFSGYALIYRALVPSGSAVSATSVDDRPLGPSTSS